MTAPSASAVDISAGPRCWWQTRSATSPSYRGSNLFFRLVNARYERGAIILNSNRGFAEWGKVFGYPVVATALLDRLLHHAVVIQIEGASYRLWQHADLIPEHVCSKALIVPPPAPWRRGRPPGKASSDHSAG